MLNTNLLNTVGTVATTTTKGATWLNAVATAFNVPVAQLSITYNNISAPQRNAGSALTVWLAVLAYMQQHNAVPSVKQMQTALTSSNANQVSIEAPRALKWLAGCGVALQAQAQAQNKTAQKVKTA